MKEGKPGALAVTGPPGIGKSAILGRIVSLSNQEERTQLLAQSLPLDHADPGVSRGEGARIIGAVIWRRITLFFSQQKRASYGPLFIQNRHPYHRFCITSSSSPVVARSCLSSFWMGIW